MGPRIADQLRALAEPDQVRRFVQTLSPSERVRILSDWNLWALPYQRIPPGSWRRWLLQGGRGTGKTRTGASVTSEVARDRKKIRTGEIGIIGRTWADARFTMVEGPSGILASAPPNFRPIWEPGNGLLIWPNGVRGRIFSADKPESFRGPNFAFVWGDEIAYWPNAYKTWWEVVEPALRIGWARALQTTTPRKGHPFLKKLRELSDTHVTRARMRDNLYLDATVKQALEDHYRGTIMGRQELDGEDIEDVEGALWSLIGIEKQRIRIAPKCKRVVVAVDPAVTSHAASDETGIIVAGRGVDDRGYVLADRSGRYSPAQWAEAAVEAYRRYQADRIVAEVNNGGDLVEAAIRMVDASVPYTAVRASRGKLIRAEPVSAMYERELVSHVGDFPELEEQLTTWEPVSSKSPDRLDALVWGLTDLFLSGETRAGPLRGYL